MYSENKGPSGEEQFAGPWLFGTKCHLFPRHPGKDAAQGPSKLPEGRRPKGSFGGPRVAFFPEGRGKGICVPASAWHKILL